MKPYGRRPGIWLDEEGHRNDQKYKGGERKKAKRQIKKEVKEIKEDKKS